MAQPTRRGKKAESIAKRRSKPKLSDSPKSGSAGTQRTSPSGKGPEIAAKIRWTIMLYIAADGNIANFGIESLKQLNHSISSPAGMGDQATVVVAAQFAIDAPGGQQIPRYIFNECSGGSIGNSFAGFLKAPDDMTEQQALISFLKWVYTHPECQADKYALILWGHGPEFLLQPPAADSRNAGADLYLSPEELREALDECIPEDQKLSIVGFDACSMSMFEMAYEIRGRADYMVASQEEVPDLSFPYDTLVLLFRQSGADAETLLKNGVYAYVNAYQDYVTSTKTGMKQATLSALRLTKCGVLETAVKALACALFEAKGDPGLAALLVEARSYSRDYAGGLYTDLVDFATKLIKLLSIRISERASRPCSSSSSGGARGRRLQRARYRKIVAACTEIVEALAEGFEDPDALVLASSSADSCSHGVSLYLPYFSDARAKEGSQPMVKGGVGTAGGKEFSVVLNHAGFGLLMCARREMIVDTESYYEDLELSHDTGWYRFIVDQWSLILAQTAPEDLDLLYSAQQCAMNLGRRPMLESPCPAKET